MKQRNLNRNYYQSSMLKQNVFYRQHEQQQQYQDNNNKYDATNIHKHQVSSKKQHPNEFHQRNNSKRSSTKLCLKFDSNSSQNQSSSQFETKKDQNKIDNEVVTVLKRLMKININSNEELLKNVNSLYEEQEKNTNKNKNVLLMNFDSDNNEDDSDDSSCNNKYNIHKSFKNNSSIKLNQIKQQQILTPNNRSITIIKNHSITITTTTNQDNNLHQQNIQLKGKTNANTNVSEMKRQKPNIILTKFTDNSDSEEQNHEQYHHNIHNKSQLVNHYQQQSVINIITIDEFSHIIPTIQITDIAYNTIPPKYVLQTIVKRYTSEQMNNNGNITYEMFDSYSYKSILKAKKVSQGYQMLLSTKPLSPTNKTNINKNNKQQISCGLLTYNFFGTQFNCYKFNRNSQKSNQNNLQKIITIDYQTNFFGLHGPRKMQVYIPVKDSVVRGNKALSDVYQEGQTQLGKQPVSNYYQQQYHQHPHLHIQKFINRTPKWNRQLSSYVLNFSGRATISSVKNFIITTNNQYKGIIEQEQDLVVFGKIDKHIFNLDIRYPFNLAQGFALALSSFDKKIGCE